MKLNDLQRKAAVVLVMKDDLCLGFSCYYRNGISLPGGRVDKGETVEQAAKREFKEETGYEVSLLDDEPYIELDKRNNTLVYAYRGEITDGELLAYSYDEGEPSWVTLQDLLDGAFPKYTENMLKHFNISV